MAEEHQSIPAICLSVHDRRDLEDELDRAVERVIQQALASPGRGILVTRHDHATFTIEVSDHVPQGTISERDLRRGPDAETGAQGSPGRRR